MRASGLLGFWQRKLYNRLRQTDRYTGAHSTPDDARRLLAQLRRH